MKRALFLCLSAFLAATASSSQTGNATASTEQLSGQNSTQLSGQASTTNFVLQAQSSCPVSLRALQGSGTGLLAVRGQKEINGIVQRIHLVLANGKSLQVESARVRVRGLSGKSRIARAEFTMDSAPDMTRTLQAAFSLESDTEVSADLLLPGFTSVSSVALVSITYKDGSTWSVPGRQFCQVSPDYVMRVASR